MSAARPLRLAACLGVVPLLTACVVHVDSGGFSSRKEQRFTVEGAPVVDLDTFDGAIEVQAWDKPEVLVRVEARASSKALLDSIDVRMEQSGRKIVVRAVVPDDAGWDLSTGSMSRSARLVASVPTDSTVRLRSGDGSVHVQRVRGSIDARTDDGRIVMREVAGEIVADSGDGSVHVEDVEGRCTVSTRDGSVLVSGRLQGGLKATSGDGSITVRVADGSDVSEDWEIETGDGGVVLALPEQFDARLDARTNDGRIVLHGLPDMPIAREGDGRSLQAVLGTGARALRIRTGDGSINLKRVHVPVPPPAPPAPPAPAAPPPPD